MEQHWPDVLIVDLCMPEVDGWTFIRTCRQDPRGARLRVVLMSAALEDRRSDEQGVAFLPKPFNLVDMLSVIEHVAATPDMAFVVGRR